MQEVNKTKDVFLTKAQFEARKTAGTLEEGVIYHTTDETVLTPDSLKTIFGNQSLVGSGNIDLYNHFIHITANQDDWYGVLTSSNNLDATGVGTKLTTLFKAVSGKTQVYIPMNNSQNNQSGVLLWTGSIWQIQSDSNVYNVTAVEDTVETV